MRYLLLFIIICSTQLACSNKEAFYVDKIEVSKEQVDKLDSAEIFSRIKYSPGEAPAYYYKGHDTTVIVVKTKKVERELQKMRYALLTRFLDSLDNGADILIVKNGHLVMPDDQKKLRSLLPSQLSNADTMELSEAKSLYGSSARPMTLVINLYSNTP